MPRPIIERLYVKSAGAASDALIVNLRSSMEIVRWTRIIAFNDGHATTYTEVGLQNGSSRYSAAREGAPNAHDHVATDIPVEVPGDWRPYALFAGATSGDGLHLVAFGYYVE